MGFTMNNNHQINETVIIYRGLHKVSYDEIFFKKDILPRRKKISEFYPWETQFHPGEKADINLIRKYLNGDGESLKKYVLDAIHAQVNQNDQCFAVPCTRSLGVALDFASGKYINDYGEKKNGTGNGIVLCIEVPNSVLIRLRLFYSNAFSKDNEQEVLLPLKIPHKKIKEIKICEDYKIKGSVKNHNFDKNASLFGSYTNDYRIMNFCFIANHVLEKDYLEKYVESTCATCFSSERGGYDENKLRLVWDNKIDQRKFDGNFQMLENTMKQVIENKNSLLKNKSNEHRHAVHDNNYLNNNIKKLHSPLLFNDKENRKGNKKGDKKTQSAHTNTPSISEQIINQYIRNR